MGGAGHQLLCPLPPTGEDEAHQQESTPGTVVQQARLPPVMRHFQSSSLLVHLGRQQETAQEPGPLPLVWGPQGSSKLLLLPWLSPGCRSHLRREPKDGDLFL